jgi:hypothetical protein
VGEGWGGGRCCLATLVPQSLDPHPQPLPQGGGEHSACAAPACINPKGTCFRKDGHAPRRKEAPHGNPDGLLPGNRTQDFARSRARSGELRSNSRLRRELLLRLVRRRASVVEDRCMDRGGRVQAVDANENGCKRSAASAVAARRRTVIGAAHAGGMGNAARRVTRRLECAPSRLLKNHFGGHR